MYLPTKMGKNNSSKSTLSIQSFLKTRFTTANLLKVKEIGNMKGKKKKRKAKTLKSYIDFHGFSV